MKYTEYYQTKVEPFQASADNAFQTSPTAVNKFNKLSLKTRAMYSYSDYAFTMQEEYKNDPSNKQLARFNRCYTFASTITGISATGLFLRGIITEAMMKFGF